jgi:uncharacterized repeat protein (TIGR04138 family)
MDVEAARQFEDAIREDGRYPPEAFEFLHRGLALASHRVHGEPVEGAARHVTGAELCMALRELARERWGPLAREVLRRWNIDCTRDFGEMVFLLVRLQLMGKQDSDHIEDFDDVFDFADAFDEYEIPLDAVVD